MAKFKDKQGREWLVEVDWGLVRRLQRTEELNLLEYAENDYAKYREVLAKPDEFMTLLWLVVKPQAEKAGVDEDAFCSGIGGAEFDAAQEAFQESYALFSPGQGTRSALSLLAKKQKEKTERAMELAKIRMTKEMDKLTDEVIEKELDNALARRSANGQSSVSLASSA